MGDWLEESMNKPKPKKQTSRKLTEEQRAAVDAAKDRTANMLKGIRATTNAAKTLEDIRRDAPVDFARMERTARADVRSAKDKSVMDASEAYEAGLMREMKTSGASEAAGAAAASVAKKAGATRGMQNMASKKAKEVARDVAERRPQSTSGITADQLRRMTEGISPIISPLTAPIQAAEKALGLMSPRFGAKKVSGYMSKGALDQAKRQAMGGMSEEQKKFQIMLDAVRRAQQPKGE